MRRSMFLFGGVLASLWQLIVNVGSIAQVGMEPIYTSIANRKLFSDYGFNLKIQNDIPSGGYIEVIFPSQYREYLGIPLYASCNQRCDRTINSVKFYFDSGLVAGSTTFLQVNQIINPETKGGTGNFQVRSRKGSNTIDENLIFGTIGMGQYPNQLTSTTIQVDPSGGSANAGDTSFYIIGFKVISFIPKGSFFRITLPTGQGYSVAATPTCSFLPVLGVTPQGTLVCTASNGVIIMRGLNQDIFKGSVLSIKLQITNPLTTISSPLFRIEIVRDKTHYIYDWFDGLVGPNILPGKLSSVAVTPTGAIADLAMGKTETLTLSFKTKNPIPTGGMITVAVPTSFAFLDLKVYDKPITYYVISGLTATNSSVGVTLNYDEPTTTLQLSGFNLISAGSTISLALTLTMPNQNGVSDSLTVTTYLLPSTSSTIIDQDSTQFTVTVANLVADNYNGYSLSNDVALGTGMTDYSYRIKTTVILDGTIKFTFRGLTLNAGASCSRKVVSGSTVTFTAYTATVASNTVTVNLAASPITAGTTGEIVCTALINLPSVST